MFKSVLSTSWNWLSILIEWITDISVWKTIQEHIHLVEKLWSKYFGHATPDCASGKGKLSATLECIKENCIDENIKALGCHDTATITISHSGSLAFF